MTETLLLSTALFGFPVGIHYLRTTIPLLKKINPIVASYLFGLLLVNSGIIGDRAMPLLDTIATVTVALSIPLMLFSVNLRVWIRESGKTGLAMVLAALSITLVLGAGRFLFASRLEDFPRLAGMLVGVYTGGTPNLAAIRAALSVPADLYLAVHASDILLSAIYLLFVITFAQPLLSLVLKRNRVSEDPDSEIAQEEELKPLRQVFTREKAKPLSAALGLAVLIFAIGASFTLFVKQESQTLVVILVITTLSLLSSLHPRIRNIPDTFAFGEYFILVFSAATGAMGNFSRILGAAPGVFLLVAFALFGSMIVHILLCRIFSIDVDTMLVASTAAICSPPFVGVTGMALKRPSLIAPGIASGLMGYALGNYLGILMFKLLC
jgi:uncharacterized membrane protein